MGKPCGVWQLLQITTKFGLLFPVVCLNYFCVFDQMYSSVINACCYAK